MLIGRKNNKKQKGLGFLIVSHVPILLTHTALTNLIHIDPPYRRVVTNIEEVGERSSTTRRRTYMVELFHLLIAVRDNLTKH